MSNRLLIFSKFPSRRQGERLANGWWKNDSGGRDRESGGGWLEVPVDNTINLLPRIVKLRWNFKLDILSENLTPCARRPGSYSFPFVSSPRSLSRTHTRLGYLSFRSFSIYLSIYLSIAVSFLPSGLYFILLFFPSLFNSARTPFKGTTFPLNELTNQ